MPVEVRNFRRYDKDDGQAGIITPSSPIFDSTLLTVTASTAYLGRVVPSRNMSIASIAFAVTTGSVGNVDVGIFDSTLATVLASSGATAGQLTAVGVKNVSLTTPYALIAGTVYYAALSCSSTPQLMATQTAGFSYATELFGASVPQVTSLSKASIHPLAAITSPANSQNSIILALRES